MDGGLSGTSASLGVLMGHVFRRSSGRGWRLRHQSMALWPDWISRLQRFEPGLVLQGPLVQIAEDQAAFERMEQLAKDRGDLGLDGAGALALHVSEAARREQRRAERGAIIMGRVPCPAVWRSWM